MNTSRAGAWRFAILLSGVSLAACGGGGGGGGSGFPDYPATTADSMLLPLVTAAGELQLFNPGARDSAPVTVDTGLAMPAHFGANPQPYPGISLAFAGAYDASTNAITGAHERYAYYVKDGALYRVDLLNTAAHAPVAFSSITDACWFEGGLANDYSNPLDSIVVVQVAGADLLCGTDDDAARLITLGAPGTDDGVDFPLGAFILEWVQGADGTIQRLIVYRADASPQVVSYAPDLSSATTLATLNGSWPGGGPDPSRTQQYFRFALDGASTRTLFRYDATDESLTPVHAYASNAGQFLQADDDYLYFGDGMQVYRVAHGSTEPQPLTTLDADFFTIVALASDRLVFGLGYSDGRSSIETLPKAGGARTVLVAPTTDALTLVATANAQVYYNRGIPPVAASAHRVGASGTGAVAYADARWAGQLTDPDANLGALNGERVARTLLLGQANALGLVTVRPVDARSGILGPVLGTIDRALGGYAYQPGRYALLNALVQRDSGFADLDVYFLDVQAADSLRAAATTADLDDAAP